MTTAANQYANKIYSEHPIALWPLDEQAYYLSLIDDNDRLLSTWTKTACTSSDNPTLPSAASPFEDNIYSSFTKSTSAAGTIEVESPLTFGLSNVNLDAGQFTVNFFLYQNPTFINWIKVGYRYNNAGGTPQEVISAAIPPPALSSWVNFNNTYDLPTSWSGSVKLFIQVNFLDSSAGDAASRTLIMNGLSVGQNSITTCYESLGATAVDLPASTGISLQGVSADQYGVLADNGYYVVRNNLLLAHNEAMPIIFGTDNSTAIDPSGVTFPSLIFPGKGMLNEAGRNLQYTLEMWMKLDPATATAKRILGPVGSLDGVYVKEGFITLVIGGEIGSHFVSDWYRPMLLHIVLKDNNATLMINGEQVVNIPFDKKTIDLPDATDWWGIYSYDTISSFNVDCISIFPYIVSEMAAKRRFVYGQGTPSIQSVDNSYQGTPTTVEFPTSEYNASIIYPDIARWDAGYFNNLTATKDYLSVPNYQLPNIFLSGRDLKEWYDNNLVVNNLEYPLGDHPKFVTFRPNLVGGVWNTSGINYQDPAYFNFPTLNVLNDQIAAVYGVFEVESSIATNRPLMSFVNVINGDTFSIIVNANQVKYNINDTILHTDTITIGTENAVGINFDEAGTAFGYDVSRFFSSPSSIQLYVGGDGITTFEGKIYAVGLCNDVNYSRLNPSGDPNFNSNGIALFANYARFLDHFASYTLTAENEYGELFLDIAVQSEWEEYFPLSYFASYVKDESGTPVYDLDMLQINIGYPTVISTAVWNYADLKTEFIGPSTYATLRDSVYLDYFGLQKRNASGSTAAATSAMKSYISFQSLASGANTPLDSITYESGLTDNNVIYPDQAAFPYNTKFAFKDNAVVFPPKNNFEDYAMVIHLQINQRAILKNPLKLRSLEISSKNFNEVSATDDPSQRPHIGTKFGKKAFPVINALTNLDYKSQNPILMHKSSTPYLYNTKKSGIRMVMESNIVQYPAESYTTIPVNESGAFDYKIAAMQFMVKPEFLEDNETIKFIEIKHKDGYLLYALNKSGGSATMLVYERFGEDVLLNGGVPATATWDYVYDGGTPFSVYPQVPYLNIQTGPYGGVALESAYALLAGSDFYQNGRYVQSPVLDNNEWSTVGIVFPDQLDFSEYADGEIRLYGGGVFNNISYYLAEGLGTTTDLTTRTWQSVFDVDGTVPAGTVWSYWTGTTWQYVYLLGQVSSYISSPADIFDSYTGTNAVIVDDGKGLQMNHRKAQIVSNASWSVYSKKPA